MKRFFITALFVSSAAFGQDRIAWHAGLAPHIAPVQNSVRKIDNGLPTSWKLSLLPVVAAHSLDIASSWGHIENNRVLAGPDQRFGMQSAMIKVGIVGVAAVVEYLVLRRNPKMAKLFTRANYINSLFTGGIAVRNYVVTR